MTNDIKSQVLSIVHDIEQGRQCESCPECEASNPDFLSGFDYIADVLDINWILDSNRELKGARLLVAFGGPNIWIDTAKQTVEGHWWGDSYTASYSHDEMGVEDACEELFNC